MDNEVLLRLVIFLHDSFLRTIENLWTWYLIVISHFWLFFFSIFTFTQNICIKIFNFVAIIYGNNFVSCCKWKKYDKKGFKKQACFRIYLKIREHANFMHYQSFLHKNLQNHGRCSADYKKDHKHYNKNPVRWTKSQDWGCFWSNDFCYGLKERKHTEWHGENGEFE